MQPPSSAGDLVPGLTVIIPHGGADRLPLLQAALPRLRDVRGIARIVLVELDEVPRAAELGRRFADCHVFAHGTPPFHKTRAMNIGLAFVRTSHFLWLDGDVMMPEDFPAEALRECIARGLDCLLPWAEVHYLSEADSRAVAAGQCAAAACIPVNRWSSNVMVPGCAVLARTDFAHRHGGMPEQFRGWGCEDTAWFLKVRTLGTIGITNDPGRILHHLYHPNSGGNSDTKDVFSRPGYRRNFAILTLMKSYQAPDAFSRRFPTPRIFPHHGPAYAASPARPAPRQSGRCCKNSMATRSGCAQRTRRTTPRRCRHRPATRGMPRWQRSVVPAWTCPPELARVK